MLAVVLVAAACAAVLLGGCGKGGSEVSAMPPPPSRSAHQAAAGPAIVEDLAIDQLALDSAIKRMKDKNGLEFVHFKYTDNDGKVYKCVLPAPMAQGKHKPSEWLTTFNIYRQPEVLAQKKVAAGDKENLQDFPFISPKPVAEKAPSETGTRSRPTMSIPTLPSLPTLPSTPAGRGASPEVMPRPGPGPTPNMPRPRGQ